MSEINHRGIITKIENGIAEVLITDNISCEGCGAKNACLSGGSKDKKFHVRWMGRFIIQVMKSSISLVSKICNECCGLGLRYTILCFDIFFNYILFFFQ